MISLLRSEIRRRVGYDAGVNVPWAGLAAALLVGCYHPDPPAGAPCAATGDCPSGLSCIDDHCVKPGTTTDAAIDACPTATCAGSELVGCGIPVTCALGCAAPTPTAPARCMELAPSNGLDPSLLAGASADLAGIDFDFNTDTGEVTKEDGMPVRPPGTGVMNGIGFTVIDKMGVFTANSFTAAALVDVGNDWDSEGSNTLVLYAATTIDIVGRIDIGGNGVGAGPGGMDGATSGSPGPTCRGKAGLWQAANFGEGGGGAGGRTGGGNGAPSVLATFGAGAAACSTAPTTIPLRGGNGGGAGGVETAASPDVVHGGEGGGGGGGIALVAMTSITISGEVTSPGDGGRTSATGDGGGGGGSGGAILLEAPVVTISGALTANGGGGAGPSVANGARGHITDGGQAAGGAFMAVNGGRGGNASPPTSGNTYDDGMATMARGGGGGGAAGRTEIKARTRDTTGAVLSPPPALSDIAVQ